MRRIIFACAMALGLAGLACAAPLAIENAVLKVQYSESERSFSIIEKATGKTVLSNLRLQSRENAAEAPKAEAVVEKTNAGGQQIRVTQAGVTSSIETTPDLPFVLIHTELKNTGDKELDIPQAMPATFSIDLGKPAGELRTLGTGGLTAPDKNPGSYLFLTAADPATRRGVVAGWLTNDRGGGVLFSDVKEGKVEFRARIDYGHLRIPPGQTAKLETLAVGVFNDARIGQELFADSIAQHYRIKLHPQISGYCTWYDEQHRHAGDERSIVELAAFAAKELKPFGFSFIQIDDEWQDGGKYNGPARGFERARPDGPYPHGMAPVAEKIAALGLSPGIWFIPFGRNHQAPEYRERQHWFVKRPDGSPYEVRWGGTSLDVTNPEVREYLVKLIKTIRGWGYTYFKMDGLWTGSATERKYINDGYSDDQLGNNAPFYDRTKTNIEAYRNGLKLLREAAGPDVYFSGCNASQNMRTLGGSIGLVDSMRIGPDNGKRWADYRKEIAENGSGSLITGPIRGTRLYFLHGRVWWNDPDPAYVVARVPPNHAQLTLSWVALSGQLNLTSCWLPALPAERLDMLKRSLPPHGATARPVDYFDSLMPGLWLVTDTRQNVRRDVLGLFNWESKKAALGCTAAKAGLDPKKSYHAFDFWANRPLPPFQGEFSFDVPSQSCCVIAVRAAEDHPVLASTSRHIAQCMIDVKEERWDANTHVLSGVSQLMANDPYELRIAGVNAGQTVSAMVSPEDAAAGVAISTAPTDAIELKNGWIRLRITSKESRAVHWSVKFNTR
jgi:hypothetical protein